MYTTNFNVKKNIITIVTQIHRVAVTRRFLLKKVLIKSFIKILEITCKVKTSFSKISGFKTATFLKMSLLFLYTHFHPILPKFLWPN